MKYVVLIGVFVLMLAAPTAASPIILSGPGWTSDPAGAFWNNVSYDGNGIANVGDFLLGPPGSDWPGFYANSPSLTDLVWLGDGSAFIWDSQASYTVLLSGVTAWSDTFTIRPDGALVFTSPYDVWTSDTLDGGRSHFAVFDSPTAWYIGMEDATWLSSQTADWDMNDLIVMIPKQPVPDGGSTVLLLGMAVAVLAWRRSC